MIPKLWSILLPAVRAPVRLTPPPEPFKRTRELVQFRIVNVPSADIRTFNPQPNLLRSGTTAQTGRYLTFLLFGVLPPAPVVAEPLAIEIAEVLIIFNLFIRDDLFRLFCVLFAEEWIVFANEPTAHLLHALFDPFFAFLRISRSGHGCTSGLGHGSVPGCFVCASVPGIWDCKTRRTHSPAARTETHSANSNSEFAVPAAELRLLAGAVCRGSSRAGDQRGRGRGEG